jgi:hypothetical protein
MGLSHSPDLNLQDIGTGKLSSANFGCNSLSENNGQKAKKQTPEDPVFSYTHSLLPAQDKAFALISQNFSQFPSFLQVCRWGSLFSILLGLKLIIYTSYYCYIIN